MSKLLIKGEEKRNKDVISLLTLLGGTDFFSDEKGDNPNKGYYILESSNAKHIISKNICDIIDDEKLLTVDEFYKKYPFKIGDKIVTSNKRNGVIIAIEWKENLDTLFKDLGNIIYTIKLDNDVITTSSIVDLKKNTNNNVLKNNSNMESVNYTTKELKEMFTSILNEKEYIVDFTTNNYASKVELILGKEYELKEENNKFFVVKKNINTFPSTYEECCKVLNYDYNRNTVTGYESELFANFQKLKICKDAYWKLYTEKNTIIDVYNIILINGEYVTSKTINSFLSFPTEEMKDVFLSNFRELIEVCKPLLFN